MGFIRTYFLAEVSLKAKEVTCTELAERREMYVRKLCGADCSEDSLSWLMLVSGAGNKGVSEVGSRCWTVWGYVAKDSWAIKEPLWFPE